MITGTWSPLDLAYPEVGSNDTGFYLITEAGTFKGITYAVNDWLIYLSNSDSKWFKTNGGIVVVDASTSSNKPDPGWYARVRLDNNGRIVAADTALEAENIPEHKHTVSNITDLEAYIQSVVGSMFTNGENETILFTYDSKTKTIKAAPSIDEETIGINEFGQLYSEGGNGSVADLAKVEVSIAELQTKINNISSGDSIATFDSSGIKIEAINGVKTLSVKVDKDSILIDENGNLTVNPAIVQSIVDGSYEGGTCANHTHTADQITDLTDAVTKILKESGLLKLNVLDIPIDEETIIINSSGKLTAVAAAIQKHTHTIADITDLDPELLVWATCQKIVAKDSTVNLDEGRYKLSTLRLDQALAAISLDMASYLTRIEALEKAVSDRVPPIPDRLNKISIATTAKINVRSLDDIGTVVDGYASMRVKTNAMYVIPNAEDAGTLDVYIDGVKSLSLDIGIPSVGKAYDDTRFKILSVEDFYLGHPDYEGYYKSYVFSFDYVPESCGIHTLKLVQNYKGKAFESNTISAAFYKDFSPAISIETASLPSATKHVSGVPCLEENPLFWYKVSLSDVPSIIPANYCSIQVYNVKQPLPNVSVSGSTISFEKTTIDLDKYNAAFDISATVFDFTGTGNSKTVSVPYVLIDTSTVESYRVSALTVQNPSELEAFDYLSDFDSSAALSNFEAQVSNNRGIIPVDDFSSYGGPNYSKYDTSISSDGTPIVWITFRFNSSYINNLTMNLAATDGSFELNKNGTLKGIELFIGQSDNPLAVNYWVNGNKPYDGYSGDSDYHFNGLDLFKSTLTSRTVTFGRNVKSSVKYVFVRLGFSKPVDLKTFVDSILESLERY